jgi:glycerophosphoryl diester phosphodiesterase
MQIPQVVAHRGYSARWPENTVASCRAAIAAGADFVEADVRFSADGTLFCFHDPVLSRLTGSSREIAACPDAELRAVRYAGEAPAAFAEIVAEISGKAGLLVDVKLAGEDVLQGVHRVLEAAAWPENVWLGLRSAGQAEAARALFGDHLLEVRRFLARCRGIGQLRHHRHGRQTGRALQEQAAAHGAKPAILVVDHVDSPPVATAPALLW